MLSSRRVISFLFYIEMWKLCRNNRVKAANDFIDILTSEDMKIKKVLAENERPSEFDQSQFDAVFDDICIEVR